jgi:hypothetical protein
LAPQTTVEQGGNGITDKGALVLAEALKADCGLQLLDLVIQWRPNFFTLTHEMVSQLAG